MDKRIIAINLPQFHPFKENDEWWGKGFTEWTNVTKAKPRFPGHYQPQLPTDTGFYDLRLPEARIMQAEMAKEYGVHGFCYYHYWFNGKRLMNEPIDGILSSEAPDFPFMLCWANENWARNWDGSNKKVLISQNYSEEDDIAHIKWLCETVFSDKRYIRVDGRPVFVIYKPFLFPDMKKTIDVWRKVAKDVFNQELYLIGVAHRLDVASTYESMGFDSALDFQPVSINDYQRKSFSTYPYLIWRKLFPNIKNPFPQFISYKNYVNYKIKEPAVEYKIYPCVSPGWDNSCRRVGQSFTVFYGNSPEIFGKWICHYLQNFLPYSKNENFIFINAWNEWAEGNHMEPDIKWGRAFLETLKDSVAKF